MPCTRTGIPLRSIPAGDGHVMKNNKAYITFFTLLSLLTSATGAFGQSAVEILTIPFGARQNAMGEVGAALADDESTVFWNPAGLGPVNERWQYGALSYFNETILPNLYDNEQRYTSLAICYQPSSIYIGGFGIFFNYLNLEKNEFYDEYGDLIDIVNSYEYVIGIIGYGFDFKEVGRKDISLGINIKGVRSALAPGIGEGDDGIAKSSLSNSKFPLSFDFGILGCFPFGLRIGFTLLNMGTSVYYIDQDQAYPIPFKVMVALGYKREFINEYTLKSQFLLN